MVSLGFNSPGHQGPASDSSFADEGAELDSISRNTYRREVNASGQEVFMTHRVARPMKFAAFISIIISMAVIFAACQGAVGPKGDAGDDGDPGATGATGPQGPQGIPGEAPLTTGSDTRLTLLVNVSTVDGAQVVETKAPIDVSEYFFGGRGTVTYTLGGATGLTGFSASLEGSMLTVARLASHVFQATDYDTPDADSAQETARTVTISAKDELDRTQTQDILLQFNTAPVEDTNTTLPAFHIGTQDAAIMIPDPNDATKMIAGSRTFLTAVKCEKFNECVVTLTSFYEDAQSADLTYVGTPDNAAVTATPAKGGLLIKAEAEYDKVVMIKVVASDPGGLSSTADTERAIAVTINPPPKDKNQSYELSAAKGADNDSLIADLDVFFKNDRAVGHTDDEVFTYALEKGTGNDLVVIAVTGPGAVSATVNAAASTGDYTFTVRCTEPNTLTDVDEVGQWIDKTFTVTVTPAAASG